MTKVASVVPNSEKTQFRAGKEQVEIARQGGIASGKARQEKATLKKTLETLLEMTNKETGQTYKDEVTIGLIKGAKLGKAENYKLIAQMLGEMENDISTTTPEVKIEIVDHSNLEKQMYEEKDI